MSSPATATTTPAQLHQSILQYLTQLQQAGPAAAKEHGIVGVEPLEVAIQLLSEATGVTYNPEEKVVDAGLAEIFTHGVQAVKAIDASPKFSSFLANLKEKTPVFQGVPQGTLEYSKRIEQARTKFQARVGDSASTASATPASSGEITASAKAEAEAAKNEGNALLGKGDNAGAAAKYSEAIRLNPQHAIYRANRAAAYVNLKEYRKAIEDCTEAIVLDPAYPKSHYRLGQAYAALGEHANAVDAFEAALTRSGKDEGMAVTIREQIKLSKAKLNPTSTGGGAADPFGGMGGLGGLGGMDFGSLLNNPALAGLMNSPEIAGMMQNPDIMNMMKNMDFGSMMKDPAFAGLTGAGGLDGAARAAAAATPGPKIEEVNTAYVPPSADDLFGDANPAATPASKPAAASKPASSGSAAGGLPSQLSNFLNTPAGQKAASDPDLAPVLEDIKKNGMGAAMKYMSNPAVMAKIQAIMGPMMGGGKK